MPKNFRFDNPQTITFTSITAKTTVASPFTITATSSVSLPVTFTSDTPTICTVANSVVTMVGATGTASITANARGNNTFSPASPVTRTFTVT